MSRQTQEDQFKVGMSILHKLMLHVILLVFVAVGISTYFAVKTEAKVLKESLTHNGKHLAKNIALSAESAFWSLNWIFMEKLLAESVQYGHSELIYAKIVKPDGEVYLANSKIYYGDMIDSSLLFDRETVLDNYSFPENQENGILLVHPLTIGKEMWYVVLGLSIRSIREASNALILRNVLWGFFILLLAIIGSFFLSKSISRPLISLSKATKIVADGNWDHNISINSKDEVGLLSYSFSRMISSLKRANEALRVSKKRFQDLIESTSDWVWEVAADGVYTYASPKVKGLLGYEPNEVIGKTPFDFMPVDDGKRITEPLRDTIKSRKPFAGLENTHIHKDGRHVVLESSGVPILDADGNCLGYRGIDRDVTERKQAEEEKQALQQQLIQAQKMESLGTLAGGIAHDFNNILGVILGYTEIAMYEFPEETSTRSDMEEVLKAAHRAKDLVKQILAFSRQSKHEKKPLKIGSIVKETLKLLRASLPTTIAVRQNIQPESGTVLADPTQVHQILMNLCTNAAHAMREKGGELKVSLIEVELDSEAVAHYPDIEPGPYLKLTVSDTGHGMDRMVMERIFDPYFTTKATGEGTGLGLAVVHGIVKSFGGEINVHSKPGEGTSFDVFLQRIEKSEAVKTEMTEKPPTGNERVLFVDDEASLAKSGKTMLELLGYTAISKTSSIKALELFRANPDRFDLVITDQTMPHMTGMELAKELLRIRKDIPLILCTGFSEGITEEKVKKTGVREFVMKPLLIRDLAKTVRKALDQD